MSIIDFHTHIYPEKIAEKAVENVSAFYNLDMQGNGTSEHLLSYKKSNDIKYFVVHSPALMPKNVQTINSFIADECKKHEEFIGFGTLHAFMDNPEEEIDRIISLGLTGIKIHPDSQRFNLDDARMMQIYKMLEKRSLPVLFHTGDYRYDYSHPRRLVNVLEKYPGLVCIGAHFGGWSVFDLALEYLKDQGCYLDISSSMSFLGPKRTRELIEIYGSHRMLFGSDFPMWNPTKELKNFFDLGLCEADNAAILYDNAAKILNL